MSNDLISRSAVLKGLNEFCGKQRYLVPENVWNMIENAPTAYNVENVVEQLEKERNIQYRKDGSMLSTRSNISIDTAIEIVKAGGANE